MATSFHLRHVSMGRRLMMYRWKKQLQLPGSATSTPRLSQRRLLATSSPPTSAAVVEIVPPTSRQLRIVAIRAGIPVRYRILKGAPCFFRQHGFGTGSMGSPLTVKRHYCLLYFVTFVDYSLTDDWIWFHGQSGHDSSW
jgi:hypothetical protein